jgi:hypothetical protein
MENLTLPSPFDNVSGLYTMERVFNDEQKPIGKAFLKSS